MNVCRTVSLLALIISSVNAEAGQHPGNTEETPNKLQASGVAAAKGVVVYVSDFDLDILHGKETTSAPSADLQGQDSPTERANALVNAVSEALVRALEKAGYEVHRMRDGEAHPLAGMQIRGVFAESDEQNRVRRLLVGGVAVSPQMLLFVGVNNLARPEQPLYALANPPSTDVGHGPVITVTSYAPVTRFELNRKPAEDDLKKIATQVAESFAALLNANLTAVAP